ncbi:MAG: IS1595 family transposase [Terriglobales bacterium]
MNLLDVARKLSTDDQCLDFIEKVRWHGVIRCPKCDSDKVSRITRTVDETLTRKEKKQNKRTRYYVCTCGQQFSPTAGTIFHDSHLPLSKWFFAVALIVDAKKGMSANQLARHLKVNYRTAWYLAHRIRKTMAPSGPSVSEVTLTQRPKLSGIVEVDETWVGGKVRGQGRGQTNKEIVMGIRERGGDLRLFHIPDTSAHSLSGPIQENVSPRVEKVMTDEYPAYPLAMMASGIHGDKHNTIRHRDRVYVRGDVHTNTIESAFSLFKRGVVGSFHKISGKHLHRYLSEFEYRFNGRDDADLFGQTVARMVNTPGMEYKELVAN